MELKSKAKDLLRDQINHHLQIDPSDFDNNSWADEIVDYIVKTLKAELLAEKEQKFYATWNHRIFDNDLPNSKSNQKHPKHDAPSIDSELLKVVFKGIEVG